MHQPAGVGVGDEHVAALQLCRHGANAFDVGLGIATDLELEFPVTLGPVTGDFAGHCLGGLLRDGAVQQEVVAVTAAEQIAHRLTGCLAKDVPAGYVEGRLDVRVALERGIHVAIELGQLRRILAKQRRCKHLDAGAGTFCVGRKVNRAKRADFAVAGDALVGLDPHDRAVKHLHRLAAGPVIAALVQRQIHLKHADFADVHERPRRVDASATEINSECAWPSGDKNIARTGALH